MTGAEGQPPFGDRVADAVAKRRSQLVLGLDPNPARLWPRAARLADDSAAATPGPAEPAERVARAVAGHCALALEATAEYCVAVKPQVACFERLGAPGWAALVEVVDRALDLGLLVITDAKRGDIDVTASAYGEAFFGVTDTPYGPVASVGADALTVNPLLGEDSVIPLLERARMRGGGLFVLVRTSNPGAAGVQDLRLADGGTVSDRLAEMVAHLGSGGIGASGLSDVGAVVGATVPERLETLRTRMPHTIFLLPGVGAQGARVEKLGAAFAPGRAGGLISVSRGIVDAHLQTGGDPADAARREAETLRDALWNTAG